MVTTTKKTRKKRTRKPEVKVEPVMEAPKIEEAPKIVETCFYCRESKYEPSTTGCPVSSHTKKR